MVASCPLYVCTQTSFAWAHVTLAPTSMMAKPCQGARGGGGDGGGGEGGGGDGGGDGGGGDGGGGTAGGAGGESGGMGGAAGGGDKHSLLPMAEWHVSLV